MFHCIQPSRLNSPEIHNSRSYFKYFSNNFSFSLHFKNCRQFVKINYSTRRNMFGRIRSSPSSSSPSMVEWFEQERPPSKLLKDDSLSIFEATLMKLKQGSRRCSSSEHGSGAVSQDSMDIESSTNAQSANSGVTVSEEGRMEELSCSIDNSSVSAPPKPNQVQEKGAGVSIQFLFSRYTSSHKKQGSTYCHSDPDPLSRVSSCVSDSESTGCSKI